RIYVNGILRGSQPHSGGIHAGEDPLRIGWTWNDNWKGAIDEVIIYNYTFSEAEIAKLNHFSKCGIRIIDSEDNEITYNNMSSSNVGILLDSSNNNTVSNNTVCSNRESGIYLMNSSENNVTHNMLNGNKMDNIHLENSRDNRILNNGIFGRDDMDTKNLAGHWKMDEESWVGAASEVVDHSGLGNDGTAVNGVTTTTGKFKRAGDFEFSNNQYIDIPSSDSLNISKNITIEAWINLESYTGKHITIVDKGGAYGMMVRQNSNIVQMNIFTGGLWIARFSETVIPLGQWTYVAGTFDSESGLARIYVNGVEEYGDDHDNPRVGEIEITSYPLCIGENPHPSWSDRCFDGLIDEVAIYNRTLSPREIFDRFQVSQNGIYLSHSDGNTLINNTINQSSHDGIHIVYSNDNKVTSNGLRENVYDNIHLDNSHGNIIQNNTVFDSGTLDSRGLVGYWKMDETSWKGTPGEVHDYSDLGNHGTSYGSANKTLNGIFGSAGDFDGVDDYIEVPYDPSLNPTEFTISLWARVDDWTGESHQTAICSRDDTSVHCGYMIYAKNNEIWQFYTRDNGLIWNGIDGNPVVLGEWIHLSAVYTGSDMLFYNDGVLVGGPLSVGFMQNPNKPLRIGAGATESPTPSLFFNSLIDEVKIYNRTLSKAEIEDIYLSSFSQHGIYLRNSTGNTLDNNTVCTNGHDGIHLFNSSHNTISNNTLKGNGQDNIHLENSHDNKIRRNNISGKTDIDTNGLVAYWKMDEASWNGTSGEVHDYSGLGNNGTAYDDATTTTGKFGRAGTFDDIDDYVDVGAGSSLQIGGAGKSFTLEAWTYRESNGTGDIIISHGIEAQNEGLHFGYRVEDKFTFAFWGDDLDTTIQYPDINEWHHWAGTYDGVTRERRLYRDGKLEVRDISAGSYIGTGPMQMGKYFDGWDFHGKIDEIKIYNRTLTEKEIADSYHASDYAIKIQNSANNTISDNIMSYNDIGAVCLYNSFAEITGNEVTLSGQNGIHVFNSSDSIISRNNITSNNNYGIYLQSSINITISENNISDSLEGVHLLYSNNNRILDNNVSDNQYGVYLTSSSNNTISQNELLNLWEGMYLYTSSNNNTISGNNISWNPNHGIVLFTSCTDNKILDNNISHNGRGILLSLSSNNNTVTGNDVVSNTDEGIYLSNSAGNDILDNNVSDNNWGLFLILWCNNNNISENNITWNIQSAIHIINNGNDNTISNNRIENNDIAVYSGNSDNNIISGNNISDHRIGIYLNSCTGGTISGNNGSISTQYGIRLESSDGYTISGNTLFGNNEGVSLEGSSNNLIYHNNFISNTLHGYDNSINSWNLSYAVGGNYW
ncbi:MAG: right-handed parallel beta-helix repeat-containing protein, partial [Methanomassiliicoccales archaeon]